MFPIGNHPAIEWIVAEAVTSGCQEIAVVISPDKRIIEDYLTSCCPAFSGICRLHFVVQKEPLGLGRAILLAKEFTDGQPVAVLLPDDLLACSQLALLQMANAFSMLQGTMFALVDVSPEITSWSENWHLEKIEEQIYSVAPATEKTTPTAEISHLTGTGRYLFSAESLEYAASLLHHRRSCELDDSMIFRDLHGAGKPLHGITIKSRRHDISTVDGYIGAWQDFGKSSPMEKYL
jgi:UTP--glucose-1-phosphate uridylyltransferase